MGIDTVKGELLRIDGDTYSVKKYDGKEAALHVDDNTQIYGTRSCRRSYRGENSDAGRS